MFRKAAKGSFGSFSAREALFAAFFAGGFLMATWITRTPAIREGLGLSIAEMGLVFLGLSLGSIPSLIFAPVLIHRAGARVMTLLGEALMLFGVFLAALPLALPLPLPGGVVTALGLGLVGFGSVFLDIAMNVAAGVIESRRGKPVLTTLHACFSLGEAVGAFFGFGCVYLAVSPMTHFLMAVGLMALLFLLSTLRLSEVEALVRASGEEAQKKNGAVKPKLRITGGLIAAVIVVFVVALCEGTANDWLPILLRESMNASTSFAALAFAVFASGLAAVRFPEPSGSCASGSGAFSWGAPFWRSSAFSSLFSLRPRFSSCWASSAGPQARRSASPLRSQRVLQWARATRQHG